MQKQTLPAHPFSTLGHLLVENVTVPERAVNLLFAALFLTVLGALLGGNLLLLDTSVLRHSALITLPCLGLLLLFYAFSRVLRSVPWGLMLTYIALCVLAYFRRPEVSLIAYIAFVTAAVYAFVCFRIERSDWAPILLMALTGTAVVLGFSGAYTSFDMIRRLQSGLVHQDTLYHASIAAMVKNYGVVSTGLNGLVETPYHALSHILLPALVAYRA
jgi:hypothetical protein